eukprot:90676-Amphidinium_carterae.1
MASDLVHMVTTLHLFALNGALCSGKEQPKPRDSRGLTLTCYKGVQSVCGVADRVAASSTLWSTQLCDSTLRFKSSNMAFKHPAPHNQAGLRVSRGNSKGARESNGKGSMKQLAELQGRTQGGSKKCCEVPPLAMRAVLDQVSVSAVRALEQAVRCRSKKQICIDMLSPCSTQL